MTNHPNRGFSGHFSTPTPQQVRDARKSAGMSQEAAALTIYASARAWQDWEGGQRRMPGGMLELFRLKTGQLALADIQIVQT